MGVLLTRMMELLPQFNGQYQDDSNFGKFLSAFEPELELLFDTFDDIRISRDVDQATFAQLDELGFNVNLTRGSDTDVQFRRRIKTEIIANKSQGDLATVLEVAELVLDKTVSLFEAWNQVDYGNKPSTLVLEIDTDAVEFNVPEPTIKKSVAGGVNLITQAKVETETIGIKEALPTAFQIISLKTGTVIIAKTMGEIF